MAQTNKNLINRRDRRRKTANSCCCDGFYNRWVQSTVLPEAFVVFKSRLAHRLLVTPNEDSSTAVYAKKQPRISLNIGTTRSGKHWSCRRSTDLWRRCVPRGRVQTFIPTMEHLHISWVPAINYKISLSCWWAKHGGIQRHLIPPSAPYFGGSRPFLKTSHTASIRRSTILIWRLLLATHRDRNMPQLTPLSDNPNDFEPLMPAQFLIPGSSLKTIPKPDLGEVPMNCLDVLQLTQMPAISQDQEMAASSSCWSRQAGSHLG